MATRALSVAAPRGATDDPRALWLCRAVLIVATLLVFSPVFSAEFVTWDDPDYVVNNALLRSADGLRKIWSPFGSGLPQYYPLVFSSYWIEYHLWGASPAGYHIVNVLLHVANALLVLELVRELGVSLWVAAGAAALFAVHPVQVESVAWVTERKNTLSGLFYLLCFLGYLRHRQTGRWGFYAAALAAFAAALLSKTQTVTLPVVIALTEWVLQSTKRLRPLNLGAVAARLVPMVVLAGAAGMLTAQIERQVAPAWVELPTLIQRVLISATAPWFYAANFLLPVQLAPIYPKWQVVVTNPLWWAGLVACVIAIPAVFAWRQRIGGLVLWGLGQFVLAMAPALGLLPFTYLNYSYVADRFVYLSCLGAGVVVAVLVARAVEWRPVWRRSARVAAAVAVVVYGLLAFRQAGYWRTNLGFWTHAVARNPDAYPPNINLGNIYSSQGQWGEALPFYETASALQPRNTYALATYLDALRRVRGPQAVADACTTHIAGGYVNAYVAYLQRAVSYEALGRRAEALADYDQVLAQTRAGSASWQQARQGRERLGHATGQ